MEIIYKKVSELVPYINNTRTHNNEQVDQICASINEYGFTNPLLIDEKNSIIAGHGRLLAAKKLKMKEVPCIVLCGLTEAQKKAYIIADNKLALNAGWNDELLKIEFENLKELDFDLNLTGFSADEIDEILGEGKKEIVEDDFDIEPPEEPKAKLGDIYRLGNHRLMCGDSTKKEDIEKLMNGDKANVVYTDPPYGMNLDTDFSDMIGLAKGNKYKAIKGDKEDFTDELINTVFNNFNYCKEIFLWGADYFAELLPNRNDGSWVVWDKQNNGEGCNDAYDKMFGSNFELCWSKNKHKRALARVLWKGFFGMQNEDTKKRLHPTQKPIELAKWFLEKFSNENDIIVDIYGGSGSTLICCEQMNRTCYMMEYDAGYIDVIINRWEQFTGKKAVKLN